MIIIYWFIDWFIFSLNHFVINDFVFPEQIGGEIIEDLGDQRESLIRTRDRVNNSPYNKYSSFMLSATDCCTVCTKCALVQR